MISLELQKKLVFIMNSSLFTIARIDCKYILYVIYICKFSTNLLDEIYKINVCFNYSEETQDYELGPLQSEPKRTRKIQDRLLCSQGKHFATKNKESEETC